MRGARGRGARLGLATWMATLLGCFSPSYQNGGLVCRDLQCPQGYECGPDNRCWLPGTAPSPEGGAPLEGPPDAAEAARPPDAPVIIPPDGQAPEATPPTDADTDPDGNADPVARLGSLELSPGRLTPTFSPQSYRYDLDLPLFTRSIGVRATAEHNGATFLLNGALYQSHMLFATVPVPAGLSKIDLVVRAEGGQALYRVWASTGGLVSYVKPPNTHVGMAFGRSVAISGTTFVVGAPDDRGTGTGPQTGDPMLGVADIGAVFIHVRGDAGAQPGWRREATLKPLVVHEGMKFGAAIAIAGDTLVVGAPREAGSATMVNGVPDGKAPQAGAAYVFVRTPDGWVQQAYLKSRETKSGDLFGSSVAISTQTTPNGVTSTTIAVGAPGAPAGGTTPRAGAVYVFVRTAASGVWTQMMDSPTPNNAKGPNEFGSSVALYGDTLVVGAPLEDGGGTGVGAQTTSATAGDSGAAYVFTRNGNDWPQPILIKAPSAVTGANFGARVAIAGQFLAVSAPRDPSGARGIDGPAGPQAPSSGAVFLYQRAGNGWSHVHSIKASNARASDLFGQALSLSQTTLVVGAPLEDSNGAGAADPQPSSAAVDSGATYIFRAIEGRWTELLRLKAPNAERADQFGNAVATDGDHVVVGAEGEASNDRSIDGNQVDNSAPGSGAVYVY